jgi:hypothetical protein
MRLFSRGGFMENAVEEPGQPGDYLTENRGDVARRMAGSRILRALGVFGAVGRSISSMVLSAVALGLIIFAVGAGCLYLIDPGAVRGERFASLERAGGAFGAGELPEGRSVFTGRRGAYWD